jgi:hypothetical protein
MENTVHFMCDSIILKKRYRPLSGFFIVTRSNTPLSVAKYTVEGLFFDPLVMRLILTVYHFPLDYMTDLRISGISRSYVLVKHAVVQAVIVTEKTWLFPFIMGCLLFHNRKRFNVLGFVCFQICTVTSRKKQKPT